jgi:hypothetical protein
MIDPVVVSLGATRAATAMHSTIATEVVRSSAGGGSSTPFGNE